jgi:hypothetical protein
MSPGDASVEPKSNSHTGARQGQAERRYEELTGHRNGSGHREDTSLREGFCSQLSRAPGDRWTVPSTYARLISAYRR